MGQPLCDCGDPVDFQVEVAGVSKWCRDCLTHPEMMKGAAWRPREARPGGPVAFMLTITVSGDMFERYATGDESDAWQEQVPEEADEVPTLEAMRRIHQASTRGWKLVTVTESSSSLKLWFTPS